MAEGGEVPGRLPGSAVSEHLSQRICQPCLEKDNLIYATGLCVDCLDYLCLKCLDDHKEQQHRVLDREHMKYGRTKSKPEDSCSESCPFHENETIQYYCVSHCHLGCKSCINFDHATCEEVHYIPNAKCDNVHYIPHESKDLVNNEDYTQVKVKLKSALDTFMKKIKSTQRHSEEVDKSCADALKELHDFKKRMVGILEQIEIEFVEKVQTFRKNAEQKCIEIRNKYKVVHEELQSSLAKIEFLQNTNQNCSSYIEMIRTKSRIKSLDDQTQQADEDISCRHGPIQFTPNGKLLDLLRSPGGVGTISSAGTRNVSTGSDTDTGSVTDWSDDFTVLSHETEPSFSDDFSVITDTGSRISHPSLRKQSSLSGDDFTVLSHETEPSFSDDFSVITDTGSRISHPSLRKQSSLSGDDFTVLSHETEPSFSDDFSVITDTGSRISHPSLHTERIQPWLRTASYLPGSNTESSTESAFITRPYHVEDLQVETKSDKSGCSIKGIVVLPSSRLVLTDANNFSIKVVDVHTGHVVANLELIDKPWDITSIESREVAITIPESQQIAFVTVGDDSLSINETLTVSGAVSGVDFRYGKLAVSFYNPHRVQILNLQGRILYSFAEDLSGEALFNFPFYVAFGQDDTTLYVSNYSDNNVVCVKVDGTVVSTYRELQGPMKTVVDSSGNVYVCSSDANTVHMITHDRKKMRVLLTQADGLDRPRTVCLSEDEDKLYVGMWDNNHVKVYKTGRSKSKLVKNPIFCDDI